MVQVVSRDAVVRRLREEIVSLELQRQQLEAKGMVTAVESVRACFLHIDQFVT